MRRLEILNITPSSTFGVPSTITVGNDFTSIFHGKEWIDSVGNRYDFDTYTSATAPLGTSMLLATTFEIVENSKYRGRYTCFTKVDDRFHASFFSGGETTIRVLEAMATDGVGTDLTDGYITNISTYLFTVTGEPNMLVLEQALHATDPTDPDGNGFAPDRTLELYGRQSTGWGEVMLQNMLRQVQCFAGPSAPVGVPFQGQLWFNTLTNTLMIKPTALNNGDWIPVNSTFVGSPGLTYRFTPTGATPGSTSNPSSGWVITHGLNAAAPYIVEATFWVNTVNGPKPILPLDITYDNANQMTVTFSSAESGYAIIRSAP